MIVILYTTLYRKGGDKFTRVANTLKKELENEFSDEVLCEPVESKLAIRKIFYEITASGKEISQLHFIGHSGMYGPMYGTVQYPEQFSPHEWANLAIPFSLEAKAYFHCCRSARWFAPFFARTFKVDAYGYHWYTTFSTRKIKFKLDRNKSTVDTPLYCFGHIGKKSHGYRGSIKKYFGLTTPEVMKAFTPEKIEGDDYNDVATLYDQVFQDIRVREDEWNWLYPRIPDGINMLDIGCGNGALLNQLSSKIESGIGVDESEFILERAKVLNLNNDNITFEKIVGPELPFGDGSFDLVLSLLSFRYLDWDPMMNEIHRVLKGHGKLLIVDMVTAPVKFSEYWKLLKGKLRHYRHRRKFPEYYKKLSKLVSHPSWKDMLKYNPIRSEHEMKWYLESRFPDSKIEVINVGWNARIIAFEVQDISKYQPVNLTYP